MAKDANAASPVPATRKKAAVPSTRMEMDKYKDMSFADIEAEIGGFLRPISDVIGSDGWGPVVSEKHKEMFVGQPFVLMYVAFYGSDKFGNDGEFASLSIITRNDEKFILNDGSTGIHQQLRAQFPDVPRGEMQQVFAVCQKGLRRSDYTVVVQQVNKDTGGIEDKEIEATTFYLDQSL